MEGSVARRTFSVVVSPKAKTSQDKSTASSWRGESAERRIAARSADRERNRANARPNLLPGAREEGARMVTGMLAVKIVVITSKAEVMDR